jgi:hypothetical protein
LSRRDNTACTDADEHDATRCSEISAISKPRFNKLASLPPTTLMSSLSFASRAFVEVHFSQCSATKLKIQSEAFLTESFFIF